MRPSGRGSRPKIGPPAYGYLTGRILDPVADNGTCLRRQFAGKLKEFTDLGGEG
jgi:hygromycin-B 7''-O-kinase